LLPRDCGVGSSSPSQCVPEGFRALEPNPRKYYDEENGELAMQVKLPADLETLVNKRLSSGGYTSIEDVFRRALEAQDAQESWTDEERQALTAHIENGFRQAERGELIDGAQARRDIQGMKNSWRQQRASKQ
jgi:Arc/MetJ-type ribon-helix-helix transcriptional regulator